MEKVKILFLGQNSNQGHKNSDPTSIQQIAAGQGHYLCESLADLPDVTICVDWNKASKRIVKTAKNLGITRVLIKNEPSVVTPGHLSKRIDSLFSKVIEVGRPAEENIYRWPQTWNPEFFDQPVRLPRTVSINANKFSCLRGELYSLRSKAYSGIENLDLYGQGWDRPASYNFLKFMKDLQIAISASPMRLTISCLGNLARRPRNFLGPSADKLETLAKYKTTLVIENSREFMSEKLIDAILAGTIPVYVGPPVEVFGIPEELVVTAEPDLKSLRRATKYALEMNYDSWKSRARLWMSEPGVNDSWDGSKQTSVILAAAIAGQ